MTRPKKSVGLVLCITALAGALAPAPPESPTQGLPEPLAINIPLAREQLKLIDQIIAGMEACVAKVGELSIANPQLNLWARRRVDALRATGAGKAEMVAALEGYVIRMKSFEGYQKALYKKETATHADILAAQCDRLEAEMLLNQEKAR